MDSATLKRLQQTELGILSSFSDYCRQNSLKYYLIGGALLGATRYGGFIPWDDDIDVAMPREDYEKLKALWDVCPLEGFFLQHEKSDPAFARCIMKLRKNNTSIIEKGSRNVKMNNGIYIDIFPIDFVSDSSPKAIAKRAGAIRCLMSLRAIRSGYLGNHQTAKKAIKTYLFWLPRSVIDKAIYRLCTLENNKDRKYAILFLHNYTWERQIHKSEVFGFGSCCSFEGGSFSAPSDIPAFLSKVFGSDYMAEPPCEKRVNPHNYIEVTFEKDVQNKESDTLKEEKKA